MKEGQLTLRISMKNGRDKAKILRQVGKTDKLIRDYLEIHEKFKDFWKGKTQPVDARVSSAPTLDF